MYNTSHTFGAKREHDGTWTVMSWQYGNRVRLFKRMTCHQARAHVRIFERIMHKINRKAVRKNDDKLHPELLEIDPPCIEESLRSPVEEGARA